MNIILILLIFEFLVGYSLINKGDKGRKIYIIATSLLIMLIVALRSTSLLYYDGLDTYNYANMFENIGMYSWKELWIMQTLGFATTGVDVGFMCMQKAIRIVTNDFHVYSFIALLAFFVPFGLFLYRYSRNMMQLIFAFVFLTAFYFTHFISGARQVYAVGLVWLSYLFFFEKKYWKMLICIIVASTIHFSSLIFSIAIVGATFIKKVKVIKTIHIVTLILIPFVMSGANSIIVFMGNFVGSEKYAEYGMQKMQGGTEMFILMMTLISLFCYISFKNKFLEENEFLRKFYIIIPCFTFFAPLIYSNGSMIRISEYFHLYLTLLIPYAIECCPKKERKVLYVMAIGTFAVWTLYNSTSSYYFFWE